MRLLMAAVALTLMGCGGAPESADSVQAADTTPIVTSRILAWEGVPDIGVMHLPEVNSFCTFWKQGHEFNFDDPATWEFVFVTVFDGRDTSPDNLDGLISLQGETRRVELITAEASEAGDVRQYRTTEAPMAVVEVKMDVRNKGYESISYTGRIKVTYPEGGKSMRIEGDCGV